MSVSLIYKTRELVNDRKKSLTARINLVAMKGTCILLRVRMFWFIKTKINKGLHLVPVLCENYEHEFQLTSEWILDKNSIESW